MARLRPEFAANALCVSAEIAQAARLCKYEATVDDFKSHRPPVDDLSFLDDLDRGLDLAPEHGVARVESSAAPPAAADDALTVAVAPRFPAL